ncbi:MAG: transketolase [Alphaproteobacteria bacterium]|nr:transketolase [Alphaproteobacteria bacterium]
MTASDLQASSATPHRDLANAIRALAMDAVEAAKSGHPGMPMGMADVATVLFGEYLKFDASAPDWPDRDRFVLSAGHGSMLLYALLYLTGHPRMELAELRRFRQLGSRTAGHPEYGLAPGIETTTGPLGQGLANAVGMAIAERHLNARFGDDLVDHRTYVIAGDGCLMEGISHEAASLAGHLGLARLVVLFDDNRISIDGPTDLTVSDDVPARFASYGWRTDTADGHNPAAIRRALAAAQAADRPSLIACRTKIGYGAPKKEGSAATHGSPLGAEEVAGARQKLGWPHPPFVVPEPVLAAWRQAGRRGHGHRQAWQARLAAAGATGREFSWALAGELPTAAAAALAKLRLEFQQEAKPQATRMASGRVLAALSPAVPELLGGSADLTGSNNTLAPDQQPLRKSAYGGRYLYYGVREHAMAAAMNGLALHGGVIPYGGTFLVFSDYCRPAIRLAALMHQRVVFVLTHDSIGLGEDGPTHQPVEQLAALRAIPNLLVFRPADAVETAECWHLALTQANRPSVIALTRQAVPLLRRQPESANRSAGGAYELVPADGAARVTLLASGSEVALALAAREALQAEATPTRVVSMPCWELFEARPEAERRAVLGPGTARVAVEAACALGWHRYTGDTGRFVGMSGFGASAPVEDLYRHFAITPQAVVEAARLALAG